MATVSNFLTVAFGFLDIKVQTWKRSDFVYFFLFLVVELFLASQIGMCTLCLVNLHCVEF